MIKGILLFVVANILAWFQFNSQFVWPWFKENPIVTCAVFSFPMSLLFWYGINSIMAETEYLWTSKLVGFGIGNIVFGVLTWMFLKEGIMNAKTMASLILSSCIIYIQIFWK